MSHFQLMLSAVEKCHTCLERIRYHYSSTLKSWVVLYKQFKIMLLLVFVQI
jgi:hypothetical protein